MATFSNPKAVYGLSATGTPTKSQSDGSVLVGVSATTVALPFATKAYCVSATLATGSDTLTIDTETGIATIGTTPIPQVETATVVAGGGATSNGNLAVTVTAARVTGSPLAFSVALTTATHTSATLIATAIKAAFNGNAALTAVYTVGGSGAAITLTETSAENNDPTLNVAITAGLGVSAITNSTNTTTGVGGVKLTNNTGDGKDIEGVSLGAMETYYSVLIKNTSTAASVDYTYGGTYNANVNAGGFHLHGDTFIPGDIVFTRGGELGSCAIEVSLVAENV